MDKQAEMTTFQALSIGILPQISVIIVNYNGWADLQRCLPSVLASLPENSEVIVVDNCSSDGSAGLIEREFPAVRLISNHDNNGFGSGNNIGVSYSTGEYLIFLNPDTIVAPGWVEAMLHELEADPANGLVTAKILLLDEPQKVNTCGNKIHLTGITLCRGVGQTSNDFEQTEEVGAVSGAAFAMRRRVFEEIQGFDDTLFMYMDDTDLSWRARLAGYRCLLAPASVVYHDYRLYFGPLKTFYQERNRYVMLLKSLHWRTLLLLLPALLFAEMITWGFVLVRQKHNRSNKLRAYWWIVEHWKEIMTGRQSTQASRKLRDRELLASCQYELEFEQTGSSLVTRLAHLVFDPFFFLYQRLLLFIIRW